MTAQELDNCLDDFFHRQRNGDVNDADYALLTQAISGAESIGNTVDLARALYARGIQQTLVYGGRDCERDFVRALEVLGTDELDLQSDILQFYGRQTTPNNPQKAVELLTQAANKVKGVDWVRELSCRVHLATALDATGKFSEAVSMLTACEREFEVLDNQVGRRSALSALCIVLTNTGNDHLVIEYATEIIRFADTNWSKVTGYKFLAMSLLNLGMLNEAHDVANKALETSANLATPYVKGDCLGILGDVYRAFGEFNNALIRYAEALNIYLTANLQNGVTMCYKNIADIYRMANETQQAVAVYELALQTAQQTNSAALLDYVAQSFVPVLQEINDEQRAEELSKHLLKPIEPAAAVNDVVANALLTLRGTQARTASSQTLPSYESLLNENEKPLAITGHTPAATPNTARDHQTTPAPFRVEMFGSFVVFRDGVEISMDEWKRKKARDVFKYLVSRHNTAVHVDELVMALWGEDADVKQCLPTLQNATSAIRTALEPHIEKRKPSRFLAFVDGAYTLNLGKGAIVDADEFTRLLKRANELSQPEHRAEALDRALELYKGEFLPQDRFEEWTSYLRGTFHDAAIEALDALAALRFDLDQPTAAKAAMARREALDPDD